MRYRMHFLQEINKTEKKKSSKTVQFFKVRIFNDSRILQR